MNQAFGKISHDGVCTTIHGIELAEDWDSAIVTKDMWENAKVKNESKHKHAEMIALCAEFAQTMEDPMTMFQRSYEGNMWIECAEVEFKSDWKYRLKPKTKLVNGVEIPDLPFTPFVEIGRAHV